MNKNDNEHKSYILSIANEHVSRNMTKFLWNELSENETKMLEYIGYTSDIWNKDEDIPAYADKYDWDWEAIPEVHKVIWKALGYNQDFEFVEDDSSDSNSDSDSNSAVSYTHLTLPTICSV